MNKMDLILEDCIVSDFNEVLTRITLHEPESDTPYQARSLDSNGLWEHDRYISREEAEQLVHESTDCWKRTYIRQ